MRPALTRAVRCAVGLAVDAALLALSCPNCGVAAEGEPLHINRELAGWPLEHFELRDQTGAPITLEQLRGRWTFMLFGDTRCGAPCAEGLSALVGLYQRLAPTAVLATTQVVFVSLDPARDSPAALQAYLQAYDPRFVGATGPRESLQRLLADMGSGDAPTATAQPASTYCADCPLANYRGDLVLVGPDQLIRAQYSPPFDVKRLTASFLIIRALR